MLIQKKISTNTNVDMPDYISKPHFTIAINFSPKPYEVYLENIYAKNRSVDNL